MREDTEYSRPVVALDIDGVLNFDRPRRGCRRHDVHFDAGELPDSPFIVGEGKTPLDLFVYTLDEHRQWIEVLRERAEVVWATTWEDSANSVFAPLLGIEPLEVAVRISSFAPTRKEVRDGDGARWKWRVLCDRYRGRPLVFIDDQAAIEWADFRGAPTLVIRPDHWIGLTLHHVEKVERFLDHVSS